ncbi:SIS domain-containing protein [Patescibacteria group bacterium]|nr:SIS domain-containing protein [Patescibacteria group bacterium]MBU2036058.1 SIS domain-containing protein [Patescibacteria group bacterium]
MNVLDLLDDIKKIDIEGVYESVIALPKQCLHAWNEVENLSIIKKDYSQIENIVFTGMGGSGLTARVIETAFSDKLKLPFVRVNDYNLPNFVNSKSLVLCSSYSGSTEEVLENVRQAVQKKAKWLAIGTGGPLIEEAKKHNVPYYQIEPKFNPCNQPRMAIGYSIVGQLTLATKLGIIDISKEEISNAIEIMNSIISKNAQKIGFQKNPAKIIANKLKGKIIVLISAHHLSGATHVFNNQINENSKTFSSDFVIPELNHHLMEGLKNPKNNKDNLFVIFINSKMYPERIQKRFEITKDVVNKNNIPFEEINLTSQGRLNQVFELIQFGAFVNFYLSILYEQNPAPIVWVDYFKNELSKI